MQNFPILTLLLLVFCTPAMAQAGQHCFVGYAYHPDSGKLAYTETHQQNLKNGHLQQANVTYRNPQGHTIAVKTMDFTDNRFVPVYRMKIPAEGYLEGIRHKHGWQMYRREKSGDKMKTKSFHIKPPMAGDSGFDPLLKAHFGALMSGKTVQFHFAVAGRLSVISMKAKRMNDTTFQGHSAVRFKAELDVFFIHWFVDPIILTYDPDSKRLLEYKGISNMHGPDGQPYKVRVSYYKKPPAQARHAASYCQEGTR